MAWQPQALSILKVLTKTKTSKSGEQSGQEDLRLVHAYKALLGCRMERFVGQFSFSNALVKDTYCKSSTAKSIDGASTPSGNTTHRNMLAANGRGKSKLHKDGDTDIFFDNNQVVTRSTRLIVGGQPIVSGCTMVMSIQ